MTFLNYPRLPGHDAASELMRLTALTAEERSQSASPESGHTVWYPTGTNRASTSHLEDIRGAVVVHATEHGFPREKPDQEFDLSLPELLHRELRICPAEAGVADVWSYFSLVLLPDVAFWRWPNEANDPAYERLLGKPRNVFRRHWWRGFILGPDLASRLFEDELVQFLERPASIGADPRVASALSNAHLETALRWRALSSKSTTSRSIPRTAVARETAKRMLRLGRVLRFSALTDDELGRVSAGVSSEALEAVALAQELRLVSAD